MTTLRNFINELKASVEWNLKNCDYDSFMEYVIDSLEQIDEIQNEKNCKLQQEIYKLSKRVRRF